MAKWQRLIAARCRKQLSQVEAAERLNVGLVTYQRWELGKRRPQPQHLRRLCDFFGLPFEAFEEVSFSEEELPSPGEAKPVAIRNSAHEEADDLRTLVAATLTARLWSLAFTDHPTCSEKRNAIWQAIKEFDSMNMDNKNYQITRREALCSLATLPIMTLGLATPDRSIPASQYGNAIAHCSASLEPCWALYRSSDAYETTLAFKCASKYLSVLQTISLDSSPYREQALDLATRYALLKTLFGWICVGPTETVQYAREAVALSKETGDISLQLSAHSKLAWAYFYLKQHGPALSTAQEAEGLLTRYTLSPVHPIIQRGIYSSLALMQARNGLSPDEALGRSLEPFSEGSALEHNSGGEFAFMTSKPSSLLLEAGWTYCFAGNQTKATETLEIRLDTESLNPKIAQSPQGRIETINALTLSLLRNKDRDMEKAIHLWVAGIEGAKALQNRQRFNEALTNYELMEVVWSGERRVSDLRDHLVHWEE